MQHLKELLICLQTFDLKVLPATDFKGDAGIAESGLKMYDICHQTDLNHFPFKYELRKLADLASVDLLMLDTNQIKLLLNEFAKVYDRFQIMSSPCIQYYRSEIPEHIRFKILYPYNYLYQIHLPDLFIVNNLNPYGSNIIITGQFVHDLVRSIMLRAEIFKEISQHALNLSKDKTENSAEQSKPPTNSDLLTIPVTATDSSSSPGSEIISKSSEIIGTTPTFKEGKAEVLDCLIKEYFTYFDRLYLLPLLKENVSPPSKLIFHGQGIQLVDAFKQLYDANLIVGCPKKHLEKWIQKNFEYVYRSRRKAFDLYYLNAIISTNSKPCQSPILDVRKEPDGTFFIMGLSRTKKKYYDSW